MPTTMGLLAGLILACIREGSTTALLGFNYSKIVAPRGVNGKPVQVNISLHITGIKVDENSQTMQLDFYFRSLWKDDRIHVPNITGSVQLDTEILSKLWVPNTFFVHVQDVTRPRLLTSASGVRLYSNKTVFHSSLYLVLVTCNFDYHRYPMDTQKCTFRIQSYGYTTKSLLLAWHESKISVDGRVLLRGFDVEGIRPRKPVAVLLFSSHYSELRFDVLLHRKLRVSLLAVYVPSLMFIFVSWLSLWVPPNLVPGRMVLAITTLLTLTSLFNANVQSMPEVSYVKAIDVWTLACIAFVFGTIVEYIIVLRLSHGAAQKTVVPKDETKEAWKEYCKPTGPEKAAFLERIYRIVSPVIFLIFNIVYWSYYLYD